LAEVTFNNLGIELRICCASWKAFIGGLDPEIAEMLRSLVRLMVDYPDEASVEARTTLLGVTLYVRVAPSDAGKLIGQGGRTARLLRQILQAVSVTKKLRIYLDIEG
jgi:predicted RNA-binding protein YlqC (UPF0109 family)